MRRKTFDTLMASAGLVLTAILLVAGGLLTWGHNFVGDQVTSQLKAQQIYFPPAGSDALKEPGVKGYLDQYAGQQLTTGAQAQAYADHFIAVHINAMTGGKTYAQLSSAAMANPNDQKLQGLVATVFKGETLRGLLLNAYAFGTMGTIAGIAAIASFIGAGIMALLSILGLVHARRVSPSAELGGERVSAPALT